LSIRAEHTPVIVLSAYDQVSDRIEAQEMGAIDYLVKPFDLSEMIARIEAFIDNRNAPRIHDGRTRLRVA
jgi:DNA-binding response OmpR family regulator